MATGKNTTGRKGKLMRRTAFFSGCVKGMYFQAISMKADESFCVCVSGLIPVWLRSTLPFILSRLALQVFLSFSVSSISPMPKLFHGHSQRGRLVTQHLPLLFPFLVLILSSFSTFWGNGVLWRDRNFCNSQEKKKSREMIWFREMRKSVWESEKSWGYGL